jgi:hypothetical protein
METVKLEIEFDIGSIEELGFGGFKVGWLDAEQDGTKYSLTSGAGCGNGLLEASVSKEGNHLYAKSDIRTLAQKLFEVLEDRLDNGIDS